jgi:predicted O-linked N-acetylglucosamine transferase (SPINDLY family)
VFKKVMVMPKVRAVAALGCAAALLLAALPAAASGYVNNAAGWAQLPPEAKKSYAQGINDAANFLFVNDDLATALVKAARTRCLVEQKTTAAILADRITNAYSTDKALANVPPYLVYVSRMAVVCRDFINAERVRIGLPPV